MGKKYFNILLATKIIKNRPLCMFPPKVSAFRKDFDETKYISSLIKDDESLKKYNKIWKKLKTSSKKNLLVNQFIMKSI